jgi:Uncharacterized conserved protein
MRQLWTMGYMGLTQTDFIRSLCDSKIEVLVDIREIPISRKKGFSKTGLSAGLLNVGIEYQHLKWLGSPKFLRHQVRANRDYSTFFKGVRHHLRSPAASEQLTELVMALGKKRCCLMCCCADWRYCHRSCVVEAVLARKFCYVRHLDSASTATYRKAG